MRRALKAAGIGVAALVVAAGAVRGFMVWDRGRDKLPELVDVPEGTRAPPGARSLFGVVVGETRTAGVDALALPGCRNTSMRALMSARRESVQSDMKAAEARGEDPDGVTGASLANYKSKKEQNPQVRISCEPVRADALKDRARGNDPGRVLFVFDSAAHALRHASFARKVEEPVRAFDEWNGAVAEMTKRFGPPTSSLNDEPDMTGADGEPFPRMKLFKKEWRFADLRAEVTAMSFGARGIDVKETLEVPWPVRVPE